MKRIPFQPLPNWLYAAGLLLLTFVAYSNSFHGPFVFDDLPAIRDNESIRRISTSLAPPAAEGNTVGGRPFLNFSFAVNHRLHGQSVFGYHVANFLIHGAAALLLFGLTYGLCKAVTLPKINQHASLFAFTTALLWAVHPLQTESVTYIVQRAESLSSAFALLSLYAFVRARTGSGLRSKHWSILSVLACIASTATKETGVIIPVLVLLIDRSFFAGTFLGGLKTRRWYYAGMALTWLLAVYLVSTTSGRGSSAGFSVGLSTGKYLLTQAWAIPHYLFLTMWPTSLIFDYGSPVIGSVAEVAVRGVLLVAAVGACLWGLWRASHLAVVLAAFFLLLAPSSSFVPVASQTVAEHRMYLPLAAVVVLVALFALKFAGRVGLIVVCALSAALIPLTFARNKDYQSAESLWADTVAKHPTNPRAQNNLGLIRADAGRLQEAAAHFQRAVELVPQNPDALNNLGRTLHRLGNQNAALDALEKAVALAPKSVPARLNLAAVLMSAGEPARAARKFEEVLRQDNLDTEAQTNYGAVLMQLNRLDEAEVIFGAVLAKHPDHARAHFNLGNACAGRKQWSRAIEHYRAAVSRDAAYVAAHANLGNVLLLTRQYDEAAAAYETALKLRPGDRVLQSNLARCRALQTKG